MKSRGIDSISSRREAALETQTNRKRKQPHPGSSQSSTNFRPVRDPIEPLRQPEIFIWIESFAATTHSRRYQHWALEVDRPPLIIGEHFWDGKSFRNQHGVGCSDWHVENQLMWFGNRQILIDREFWAGFDAYFFDFQRQVLTWVFGCQKFGRFNNIMSKPKTRLCNFRTEPSGAVWRSTVVPGW